MKCIVFVVMLALAAANASILAPYPYAAYSPYAYSAYAPAVYAHPRAISLTQGIAAPYTAYAAPVPVAVHASPIPSASYVAATRGATHVAPLPGHVNSVSSQNLEAAPGTW